MKELYTIRNNKGKILDRTNDIDDARSKIKDTDNYIQYEKKAITRENRKLSKK